MYRTYYMKRACGILYRFLHAYSGGSYLLPANVCPVVPLTFKVSHTDFEFVDIDSHTHCIDENRCLELLSKHPDKYKGIIFVRTYGYMYDTSSFFRRLREIKEEFKIVDDRCLVCPDRPSGLGGADLILYSTGYAKYINLGEGGIGLAAPDSWLPEVRNTVYDGTEADCLYKEALAESRLMSGYPANWLDTGDLNIPAADYEERIRQTKAKAVLHKSRLNGIYREFIPEEIQLEPSFQNWRFNILTDRREEMLKRLFENNLFASSHYKPCNVLFDTRFYPNVAKLYSKVINLFNDFFFSEEQAVRACQVLHKYL